MMDYAALAEQQWHIPLRHATGEEYVGPCPFCHDGDDRFHVWAERGNYWCRMCDAKGWVSENDREFTAKELLELRVHALERKQEEHERRLTALERMARCRDHLTYHKLLDDSDRAYWHGEGIWDETIDRYLLGVCYRCPTDRQHRPSYTIPVINRDTLVNIRHRIVGAEGGDKYRPHLPGLGNTLFDADRLYEGHDEIIIVEGEKKAMVLNQWHFPAVGMMGKAGFPPHWAQRFTDFQRVLVALDPDAQDEANKLARLFGDRGRVVVLPVKPDDFFVAGGTDKEFRAFLRWAKKGRA